MRSNFIALAIVLKIIAVQLLQRCVALQTFHPFSINPIGRCQFAARRPNNQYAYGTIQHKCRVSMLVNFPHDYVGKISKIMNSRNPPGFAVRDIASVGRKDGKRRRVMRRLVSLWSKISNNNDSNSRNDANRKSLATSDFESLTTKLQSLENENKLLHDKISDLELEKEKLRISYAQQRIVLENFEGEGTTLFDSNGSVVDASWWEDGVLNSDEQRADSTATDEECLIFDENACPIEPDVSFQDALRDRAYWLVGLLALQSMSGFILARNEELLQTHPFIVYFLTMLVSDTMINIKMIQCYHRSQL